MPDPESPSSIQLPASDPGPLNHKFYPALDGVRGLAFLMVFAFHYVTFFWGWTGVDLFFVLSGFLITGILFDTKETPHRIWNFYIRRTLRVFPLFYGLLAALLLTFPFFKWRWDTGWFSWPFFLGNLLRLLALDQSNASTWLLVQGRLLSSTVPRMQLSFSHLWSLCVEEQFYLFWAAMVFYVKDRRRLIGICLAFIVITPLLRVLGAHVIPALRGPADILYRTTFLRCDALLFGGLIALIQRGEHKRMLLNIARLGFLACSATLILWLALDPAARVLHGTRFPLWTYTWGLSFVDLFATTVVVMALEPSSWIHRLLMLKPLRWTGRLSYGAYILHEIPHTIYLTEGRRLHASTQNRIALLALVCTLSMAWVSFRFFESPFIRMKEALSR